jgi:hypothetical protein
MAATSLAALATATWLSIALRDTTSLSDAP